MMNVSVLKSYMEIINGLDSIVFIKREELVNTRRHFENDGDINLMEMYEKEYNTYDEAYELASSMMFSEWMLEIPENIDDWIAVLCPEGKRCCVIAQNNKTRTVNKFGTSMNYFFSLLPYGCYLPNNYSSHHKRTVLDCLYNNKLKTYYILDIIEWMGVPYTDFDAEFRFYFIQSKLSEIPGIEEKSINNTHSFKMAPRMVAKDLYPHLLEKNLFFTGNVELDGINFYYPEGLYTPGESPLVLWLKPFMIPDVLQKPVHDLLVHLHKPPDYVNIIEYASSSRKKKNKRNKKKNSSLNSDKMEVDNLVEVEIGHDLVENAMLMEN